MVFQPPETVGFRLFLNRLNKFHNGIAVFLGKFTELLDGTAGVAFGVAMPHDSLDDGTGAAVVQTVAGTGADGRESPTPQRRGTAPAGADVVFHVKLVLDIVAIRPNLLVGITWQTRVAVGEEAGWIGEVVVTGLP